MNGQVGERGEEKGAVDEMKLRDWNGDGNVSLYLSRSLSLSLAGLTHSLWPPSSLFDMTILRLPADKPTNLPYPSHLPFFDNVRFSSRFPPRFLPRPRFLYLSSSLSYYFYGLFGIPNLLFCHLSIVGLPLLPFPFIFSLSVIYITYHYYTIL